MPDPTRVEAPTGRQRPGAAIVAGLAGQTAASVPISLIGALAPELQRDLHFGDAALGAMAAAFFLVAAVLAPAGGRVVDRFGSLRAMWLVSGLVAVGLVVQATASSSWMLVGGALLGALAMAVTTGATNVLLVEHVSVQRRGVAFGTKQAAVPLAAMLSGLALPAIALTVGWRWVFVAMLVFPAIAVATTPGPLAAVQATIGRVRPPKHARPRALIALAIIGAFGAASVSTLNPFLVRGGTEAGFSTASAGVLLSVAAGLLVVSRVAWGAVLDRSPDDPMRIVGVLLAGGAVGFVLLATETQWLYAAGAVIAYVFGWAWPGVLMVAAIQASPDNPGEASGVLQLGNFTGATISPLVAGLVAERAGFGPGYALSALWALVALSLVLRHRRATALHRAPIVGPA